MNIVFAGTPDFAVASLKALCDSRHRVIAVYTQPDRPAGRGRKLQPSPVKQFALERGIDVFQPTGLKEAAEIQQLADLKPDLMVVVAYGVILPQAVLDIPRLGCLNVHASLLPRWRGAAPIQRAIEAGDKESGVTIMQMAAGLDTGPMLLKRVTPINKDDTAATLHDRLAAIGAEALLAAIDALEAGTQGEPQDESAATYASKLAKAEAEIDWTIDADSIARKVRAFNPWPAANTLWQGKRLRILTAEANDSLNKSPGEVIAADGDGIVVATGSGSLVIRQLQLEGGKPQAANDFLNGHSLQPGDRLGA